MSLKERVYSVLVVSSSETFIRSVSELLPTSLYDPVVINRSLSAAKRSIAEREYDFVVINAPLPDGSGARFAIDCAHMHSTVPLLIVRADIYEEARAGVQDHGVFTLCKPVSKQTMSLMLDWMVTMRERLRKTDAKVSSVEERMEEIRLVNRAKLLLISELKMTETDAHHYIEKSAMDQCIPKRQAAEKIIHMYS